MEPMIIALICAASFGAVVAITAFLRQILLSRDKLLNDKAQRGAFEQESNELKNMRDQMVNTKRYELHYKVLGANKEAIMYLDNKIEELLRKKNSLVARYSEAIMSEASATIEGKGSKEKKEICSKLKKEIDKELSFYEVELKRIQETRTTLWDAHSGFQEKLMQQEAERNERLDLLYKQHTSLLEKVSLRHIDDEEHVATQSINAGTSTFKSIIMAPIHFLLQYFNISSGILLSQAQIEQAARDDVDEMEKDINDTDDVPDADNKDDNEAQDNETPEDTEEQNEESGDDNIKLVAF